MTLDVPRDAPAPTDVGSLVRHWRQRRRLSQQALSDQCGVSTRHLSYIETGRARPSPTMVGQLSEALAVPLRERRRLFTAAGLLFESDGTQAGTRPVLEVTVPAGTGVEVVPFELSLASGRLLFRSWERLTGSELWALEEE